VWQVSIDGTSNTYRGWGCPEHAVPPHIVRSLMLWNHDADWRFGRLPGISLRICCSAGPWLDAGRPSGTESRARRVSVRVALLRSSSRRSGSIFIVLEVATVGYGRESVMSAQFHLSRLPPIYAIYGVLYTILGLGGRHTGPAGQAGRPNGRPVGSTGTRRCTK
jgi:hypothetical protein